MTVYTAICTSLILLPIVVIVIAAWWNVNPFQYPYYRKQFNVTGKRLPRIDDYIDLYICSNGNDFENLIDNHALVVQKWKAASKGKVRQSLFRKHREKQFRVAIDDEHEFQFELYRNSTRYTQKNYVRTSYQVSMTERTLGVDADWLLERYRQLRTIGFETDLSQNCGKYMPDRVGLQIDHIVPVAKGGKTVESNLQVLCSRCNGSKGAKEPDAFY